MQSRGGADRRSASGPSGRDPPEVWRLAGDPAEDLRHWSVLKRGASEAIVRLGGTISHQHGVGTDHAGYLGAEKGELGLAALEAARAAFDPDGLMNPGVLPPD